MIQTFSSSQIKNAIFPQSGDNRTALLRPTRANNCSAFPGKRSFSLPQTTSLFKKSEVCMLPLVASIVWYSQNKAPYAGKKNAARRNIPPRQRLPLACPASSRTKGVLPDNVVSKLRYLQSADVSWSKVAVKSRRHRRSGLVSSTEGESADLTRDCPLDAAALNSRRSPQTQTKKIPVSCCSILHCDVWRF